MMAMDRDFLDCVDGIHGRLCRLEGRHVALEGMHAGCRLELGESFLVGVDDAKGGIQTTYVQKLDLHENIKAAHLLMVLRFTHDPREFRDTLKLLQEPVGFDEVIIPKEAVANLQREKFQPTEQAELLKFIEIVNKGANPLNTLTLRMVDGLKYAAYMMLRPVVSDVVLGYAIWWCENKILLFRPS